MTVLRHLGVAVATGVALAAMPAPGQSSTSPCETSLRPVGPSGYRQRGDRCEGVYVTDVSGGELWLASLTGTFARFDPDSVSRLVVRWRAPGDSTLTLRARSIRPNLYYGMDTRRPAGSHEFVWPTTILGNAGKLRPRDLGVLAWVRLRVGSEMARVHVPVDIVLDSLAPPGATYEAKVYSSVRLRELYWKLTEVDAHGADVRVLVAGDSLGRGTIGERQAVTLTVRRPGRPGLYRLDVMAYTPARRAVTLAPVFFHHPEG